MPNVIRAADLMIPPCVSGTIEFKPGLNLISGENGTFKTKILQLLRAGPHLRFTDPDGAPRRVQAISPRRNAQRRAVQEIYNELRRNDTKLAAMLNERNLNDANFEVYPSIGDLFYAEYGDLCRDGGNQIDKMRVVAGRFNEVVHSIFEHYDLEAVWDESLGAPRISLLKHGTIRVPLEGLSLGEQEILSLATYIHTSRNAFDVFLIDEPEVHLNWHLEERLFHFFDDYCRDFDKQMIVVTHSRVVFTRRFLAKTTFLYWDNGFVRWGPELTQEQRRRLAGDAIDIIRLGSSTRTVVFVEDSRHALVIEALADALDAEIVVTPCGNKSNVRSLYRFSQIEGWPKSYFIEDGDNEGSPFDDERYIHLDKYCIESYLIHPAVAARVSGRSETEVRTALLESIAESKDAIFRKNKFLEFLLESLTAEHMTTERLASLDASIIFASFVRRLGCNEADYVRTFVEEARAANSLGEVFPNKLVKLLESLRDAGRLDRLLRETSREVSNHDGAAMEVNS